MPKKVAIGAKPKVTKPVTADEWVNRGASPALSTPREEEKQKIETTRFTIDIPVALHSRIKSQCALRHVKMREEIQQLLEEHFGE
jgi:hypothetical protein